MVGIPTMIESASKAVWSEEYWLPQGIHWSDFKSTAQYRRPQLSDLYYTPVFAICLLFVRYLFESWIARPFCLYIGVKDVKAKPHEANDFCERIYTTVTKSPSPEKFKNLAKQLGWEEARVKRWFRRRAASKVLLLAKATECCWRCFFYTFLCLTGCYSVLTTKWFYDTRQWNDGQLINQDFATSMRIYYNLEFAFYTSLLFSQFIDTKRKDFYQMFVHHIVTLALIHNSMLIGLTRIGSVVLLLHDASDIWLEGAKVFNYAKRSNVCDVLFVIFAVVFYLTRWIYYPFWVIHCFMYIGYSQLGGFGSYYHLNALLLVLQVLHVYWGILIGNMVYKFVVIGKIEKDNRSEDDSSEDEKKK